MEGGRDIGGVKNARKPGHPTQLGRQEFKPWPREERKKKKKKITQKLLSFPQNIKQRTRRKNGEKGRRRSIFFSNSDIVKRWSPNFVGFGRGALLVVQRRRGEGEKGKKDRER